MDDMATQMNAILNDPEMMQKIMSIANSMSSNSGEERSSPPPQDTSAGSFPDIDFSVMQKLAGFAGKANIDSNQRSLLKALTPYLSKDRIGRLERAMRAAKLAGMASVLFGNAGFPFRASR